MTFTQFKELVDQIVTLISEVVSLLHKLYTIREQDPLPNDQKDGVWTVICNFSRAVANGSLTTSDPS